MSLFLSSSLTLAATGLLCGGVVSPLETLKASLGELIRFKMASSSSPFSRTSRKSQTRLASLISDLVKPSLSNDSLVNLVGSLARIYLFSSGHDPKAVLGTKEHTSMLRKEGMLTF